MKLNPWNPETHGFFRDSTRSSPDDTHHAVKTLALPIRTFHRFDFFEINVFSYPALCAVGKGRRGHPSPRYLKLPAVDAEPAVVKGLSLIRKALHGTLLHNEFPVRICSHDCVLRIYSHL